MVTSCDSWYENGHPSHSSRLGKVELDLCFFRVSSLLYTMYSSVLYIVILLPILQVRQLDHVDFYKSNARSR
jgi:hypothetical protein